MTIYEERIAIEEELQYLYRIDEARQRYVFGIPVADEAIRVIEQRNGVVKLCMKWIGRNDRAYERCLFAKR